MFSVIKYCTQYTTILYCTCPHTCIILMTTSYELNTACRVHTVKENGGISPTLVFRPHLCQIVNMQLHLSYNPLGSQTPPNASLESIKVKNIPGGAYPQKTLLDQFSLHDRIFPLLHVILVWNSCFKILVKV